MTHSKNLLVSGTVFKQNKDKLQIDLLLNGTTADCFIGLMGLLSSAFVQLMNGAAEETGYEHGKATACLLAYTQRDLVNYFFNKYLSNKDKEYSAEFKKGFSDFVIEEMSEAVTQQEGYKSILN